MRRRAHFHDGAPLTSAADVVFTHEILLREKGSPFYRARFYDYIANIEALDDRTVRFTAKNLNNPEILKVSRRLSASCRSTGGRDGISGPLPWSHCWAVASTR